MISRYLPNSIATQGARKFCLPSKKRTWTKRMLGVAAGIALGAANGIFGAGGGMLAVPALAYIAGLDDKSAHATAIAVVLPLCVISVAVYAARASFDMSVALPTALGVFAGGIAGALLLKKTPPEALSFVFYALMLISGIKMLT